MLYSTYNKTTNGDHIITRLSNFIPPSGLTSLQLKLGAFCALKEVRSWGDAGGGALEIDQWQICDCRIKRRSPTCTHTRKSSHTCTHDEYISLHVRADARPPSRRHPCPEWSSSSSGIKSPGSGGGWVLPSQTPHSGRRGQRSEHLGLVGTSGSAGGRRDRGLGTLAAFSPLYLLFFEVSVFAASCPLLYKFRRRYWTSKTTSQSPSMQPSKRGGRERRESEQSLIHLRIRSKIKRSRGTFNSVSFHAYTLFLVLVCAPTRCCMFVCVLVCVCVEVSASVLRDLLKGPAMIPEFLCVKCLLWVPFIACVLYGPWSHSICLPLFTFLRIIFMASSLLDWTVPGNGEEIKKINK